MSYWLAAVSAAFALGLAVGHYAGKRAPSCHSNSIGYWCEGPVHQ